MFHLRVARLFGGCYWSGLQIKENNVTNRFLDVLINEGILADGAIGTEIYSRGIFINRCYDELNLSTPDLIKKIHLDYLNAGSGMIKTNTFTANRVSLAAYGLEKKTKEINEAGVRLAREVVGKDIFIAGSVGPVSTSASMGVKKSEWSEIFSEQMLSLANAGADVILLETFTNLDELHTAIITAKSACNLPVIAQVSIKRIGEDEYAGFQPEDAVRQMAKSGADVVGVNCADGPQGVFETAKRMIAVTDRPISVMPNAGMPQVVQGRMLYLATPEYMAEYAKRYAQLGISLIGGCCGTTPAHIKEMKKFLKSVSKTARVEVKDIQREAEKKVGLPAKALSEKSLFGAVLNNKFAISVEVDPPLGISAKEAVDGAKLLKDLGVDAVNIADGPRAVPRMSPMALAEIIKKEVGIEPIVHYCCRDRNILGMQMDLLGAAALGLNNLLIITGDPPKMGHYPDATAVFDMDSIGLISFVANMNRGLDFAGRPIKGQTSFVIGCGCNPGAVDTDLEAERYRQKVEAGAEYVFSQPVYDLKIVDNFLAKIKGVKKIPFFVGVLPLTSLKNAEFLHNEVPGMQVPDKVMNRIRAETSREGQRAVGLEVAADILAYARDLSAVGGAYIFPPFGKYNLIEKLLAP